MRSVASALTKGMHACFLDPYFVTSVSPQVEICCSAHPRRGFDYPLKEIYPKETHFFFVFRSVMFYNVR